MWNYIKIDLRRALLNIHFLVAILGVIGIMVISSIESRQWHLSVLNTFYLVTYSMPFLLTFIFSTMTYSDAFSEDIQCKYIYAQLIRGDLRKYMLAKVISIFISGLLTMTLGMFLYAILLRGYMPWLNLEESTFESLMESGGLREVLQQHSFLLYYFLFSLQYGIVAGVLSVFSAYMSLYYANKLFILTIPIVVWYFIDYTLGYFGGPYLLLPNKIFNASNNIWGNDILAFLYAVLLGIVLVIFLAIGIHKRLNRIIYKRSKK